jgi:hypothetical protein
MEHHQSPSVMSHEHCPCCFNFDSELVAPGSNNDVRVDSKELVVLVLRDIVQFESAAISGCDCCTFIVKALTSSGLLGIENQMGIQLYLRLPIGHGNPEILFGDPERSQMFLQFYTDYGMNCLSV